MAIFFDGLFDNEEGEKNPSEFQSDDEENISDDINKLQIVDNNEENCYNCDKCDRKFKHNSSLSRHKIKYHNKNKKQPRGIFAKMKSIRKRKFEEKLNAKTDKIIKNVKRLKSTPENLFSTLRPMTSKTTQSLSLSRF